MLHKAGKPQDKDGNPKLGQPDIIETKTVDSLDQETHWNAHGFYRDPSLAVEKFKAQEVEIAKLAAEINWDVKNRLSPNAAADVEAARNRHPGYHMPEVPSAPIDQVEKRIRVAKRGRPRKAAVAAGE